MNKIKLGILQSQSIENLEGYIRSCADLDILLLPEYVVTPFFGELSKIPKKNIVEFSMRALRVFKNLCKKYSLTIVAPMIFGDKNLKKQIAFVFPDGSVCKYDAQRLMPYSHWNEKDFFRNKQSFATPFFFETNGIKISAIFGYELHFDEFFLMLKQNEVDLLLLPSVCTFGSINRWREICKSRAFLNSIAIARANRLGSYFQDDYEWKFYGDSFVCGANGEILDSMGQKEGLLVVEVDKNDILQSVKEWGFRGHFEVV